MAEITDDRTKDLTEAELDPIGAARKSAKAWVDQGKAARERVGVGEVMTERDERIKTRALELAIDSLRGENPSTEAITKRATAFEAQLRGEADGSPA